MGKHVANTGGLILGYLSLWPLGCPTCFFNDLGWTGIVLLCLSKVFGILSTKSGFLAWFASPPDAPAIGTSVDLIWKHFIHPRISPNNTILGMVLGHGWHFALSSFLWFFSNRISSSSTLLFGFFLFTFPNRRVCFLQNAAFLGILFGFARIPFFGPFATRSRLLLTALLQFLLPGSSHWGLHLRGHFRKSYLREEIMNWLYIEIYRPFETAFQIYVLNKLFWKGNPWPPTQLPTFSGVSFKGGRSTGLGVTWSMSWVSACAMWQSGLAKSMEDQGAIMQTCYIWDIACVGSTAVGGAGSAGNDAGPKPAVLETWWSTKV